jgi:thiol-disulfide isomerase/thioredoxin
MLAVKNMKQSVKLLMTVFLPGMLSFSGFSQESHVEPVTLKPGDLAPDFVLPGTDGKIYSLGDFQKSPVLVIIFSCNHCPTAQAYEDRIISVSKDYKSKGVSVAVISSSSVKALNYSEMGYTDLGDSFEDMNKGC